MTMAPLPGSPAIDHGSAVPGITADQRGSTCPFDDVSIPPASGGNDSDIGAFEVQCVNVVVNNADSGPGSLRQAVIDSCPGGTITFANTVVSPISLSSDQITIDKDLRILGPGANQLTVQNTGTSRVFQVNSNVSATISGLTISGCSAIFGGGIFNFGGSLTLSSSTISNNSSPGGAGGGVELNAGTGALTNTTVSDNSAHIGGGLSSFGRLTLTNSTFANNIAVAAGGGINNDESANGTVSLRNSIIAGNTAPTAPDFYNTLTSQAYNLIGSTNGMSGTVATDITNVNPMVGSLSNNGGPTQTLALLPGSPAIDKGSAVLGITTDQRGVSRPYDYASIPPADGGDNSDIGALEIQCSSNQIVVANNADTGTGSLRQAVDDLCSGGTITFANTVVSPISLAGGQITIDKNLTIQGPGANLLTVQNTAAASETSRVFQINSGVSAAISGLTISGGNVSGDFGGGIVNFGGNLTLNGLSISNNTATSGGGIFSQGGLTLINSTISNNSAPSGVGGGVEIDAGTAAMTNSTVSNNSAASGGGVSSNGELTLTNSTISYNSAVMGGGIDNDETNNGIVNSRNSIIAGNTAPTGPDFHNSLTSQGYNLIGDISGMTGNIDTDITNVNPMLGQLAGNGGPTQTIELQPGSPAIDKGSAVPGITTDQRGETRLFDDPVIPPAIGGDNSDIGAFESGVLCANSQIAVSNNADSGAGRLRQAVADLCPGGTITFASTVATPISLSGGQIAIVKNLTILGPGANLLTVQNTAAASDTSRVFWVNGSAATISGLTILGGNVNGDSGGGIYNGGTLMLVNSAISNNSASVGGGIFSQGNFNITNSTVSNNSTAGTGGGIENNQSTATVINSTISNNSALSGGGIKNNPSFAVILRNSIIAGNIAATGPDLNGTVTSQGYNLIGSTNGATINGGSNDILNQDPMLGALANNGGPTQTHALLSGSPALDKGSAIAGVTTDQRRVNRPFDDPSIPNAPGGDGSDIGAFEFQLPSTLGIYPAMLVNLSGNTSVTPDALPTGASSIHVTTSTNFKGTLAAYPASGVVTVTDAHPAGVYTVKVKASAVTTTFTLTVETPPACSGINFTSQAFGVGADPSAVAIGDFNGDGIQDLATANIITNNVSILLGTGTGGFGAPTSFAVGMAPTFIAVGDFNGDGKQDLVTSNSGSNNVSVINGTGTGSFGAATNYAVGAHPNAVAVGDFNGDGVPDLTTANIDSDDVSILIGSGSGGFGTATNFSVGTDPISNAVGDFNGDGIHDLAAANIGSDAVSVLIGTGLGGFEAVTNFTVGAAPGSVTVGDFNGDGNRIWQPQI